jgi:ABC-type multidrug transport system ATPase subunit
MAQRVGLAAAIAPSPDLLILDEPLSDLDPAGAQVVMERLIEQTRRGTTLIVASHRVQATAPLADQMAWLSKGRLVRLGAADEILGALPVRVTYTLPATSAEVTEGEALPARHPLRIRRVTALRKARLLQQIKEGGGRLLGVDPELVQPPNPADNEATLA